MKFATICAIATATAYAAETETTQYGGYQPEPQYNGYAQQSYGHGFGYEAVPDHGREWVRRSTIRPNKVKAYNAEPVDPYYYKDEAMTDETIIASCEMDFFGYYEAAARFELKQDGKGEGDLTAMLGSVEGIGGGIHALKIHEFGDLEYGCESTGYVFNPFGAYAGSSHEDIRKRRVGDIEQVKANKDGKAYYQTRDLLVNLSGPNSVMGRSMVMYEGSDAYLGERVACCVIGLAKGEKVRPEPVQRVHLRGEPKKVNSYIPQHQGQRFGRGFGFGK